MSTVARWLAEREPPPPPALLDRLRAALGDDGDRDVGAVADVCLRAGERLLAQVLREESASRDCAFDLLAADALVTYAFEAASGNPADLPRLAASAMRRIAELGLASERA